MKNEISELYAIYGKSSQGNYSIPFHKSHSTFGTINARIVDK